ILKLLQIKRGVIALTKIDLVKKEQLNIVVDDINKLTQDSFLQNAPIVPVSNVTGEGIEELKKILDQLIEQTESKKDKGIFRMPIDRCFTMKGFGTVIAGTVLSGKIKIGDTVELLPQKKQLKIRGIEVHNKKAEQVGTGFRAAINIAGAEKEEIERGNVIAQPGYFEPSLFMNGSLYLLNSAPSLKTFSRVRLHLETSEILARVVILDRKILEPGEKAMVQFRLETPAVCDIGDRFVIRAYVPPTTIGGGVILEPRATKIKGFDEEIIEHLQKLDTQDPLVLVEEDVNQHFNIPVKIEEIAKDVNLPLDTARNLVVELTKNNAIVLIDEKRGLYYSQKNLAELKKRILEILRIFHQDNSTLLGMPRLELITKLGKGFDNTLFSFVLQNLKEEKKIRITEDGKVSLFDFCVSLDKELEAVVQRLEKIFIDSKFQPPQIESLMDQKIGSPDLVKKAYRYLLDNGTLIHVGEGIAFHKNMIKEAQTELVDFLQKHKEMRVAEFRDLLNASRKYALPLLIYFDTKGITIKRGEVRVLGSGGGV
ncbi:MAG: SelB C-terminal domain-containing protein, partial [candidate division WOR-3 bacterium]